MRTFEGKFDGRNVKIGIVAGRFNEFITSKLVGGALDVLKRNDVSEETDLPVIFGVLTTNNIEEAIERAGTKAGNKGSDAAFSAIEMINLIKEIEK